MADLNETQPVIAVQPTQPAKVFNLDSITLKGADIYGKMRPFSQNARDYKSDSMSGEQYYLYRFMGTIVTMPTDFHRDYLAHEVLEVTMTGSINNRSVPDPNVAGGTKIEPTQSYGYDGHLTPATEIAMLKLQKHKMTMQRAVKSIQKIDVTKELSESELAALLAEA